MLELFMCLRLALLDLFLNFYSLEVTFFSNFWSQFIVKFFVISIFPSICIMFCIFSQQESLILKKKNGWLGVGGLIQLFKPKNSPN